MPDPRESCRLYSSDNPECTACTEPSALKQVGCASDRLSKSTDPFKIEMLAVGMYFGWGILLLVLYVFKVRLLTTLVEQLDESLGSDLWVFAMVIASFIHAAIILTPIGNRKLVVTARTALCGMSALFWTFSAILSVISQRGPTIFSLFLGAMVVLSWWVFMRSGTPECESRKIPEPR